LATSEYNQQAVFRLFHLTMSGALIIWIRAYVKDRFREEIDFWIASVNGSLLGNFVQKKQVRI
tara:strand:- start:1466 stop:1654 length:189 start_codon:yes stop_codon:yes gene_type:complete